MRDKLRNNLKKINVLNENKINKIKNKKTKPIR
jgi:hypothetical protein